MAIGLPASGKSTYYEMNLINSDVEYISSDKIREEEFGNVNDQSHNNEVFNLMHKKVINCLKTKKSFYYDATNLSAKRRINFLKEISKHPDFEKIALVFVPPMDKIFEQNRLRKRHVPHYAIHRMFKSFEVPHYSEGWDSIVILYNSNDKKKLAKIYEESKNILHDNHNHSLSVGNHMMKAFEYARNNYYEDENEMILSVAAQYHDIGKPVCKVFENSKGEYSEEAHFYNHENTGAYLYLSYSAGKPEDLLIANLIQHHMDFFKGEKYLSKIHQRFGDDFFVLLTKLHDCDIAAH